MSSSRQHGAQHPAEEHDPTGVRALLSSLPDPGPMPEHLVLRIQQSLEREQEHRQRGEDPAAAAAATEFLARREQREQARRGVPRWAPWAGAAAAVAAGAMVVSAQFLGGAPMADITASVGGTAQREAEEDEADAGAAIEEEGEELAPMAEEGQDDSAEAGGDEDLAGSAADDSAVIQLGDRTADDVEQLLREWYAATPGPSPWGGEAAAMCAAAGRVTEQEGIDPSAYPARWQDEEAVVLLLPSAREAEEAWVVEAGCLQGRLAEVLHGPVPLGQP